VTTGRLLLGNEFVNTPAGANALDNRTFIARQRCGKQDSSKLEAVFSVGRVQIGYKRDEFRSWQLQEYGTVVGRELGRVLEMAVEGV
jgi:hypothetical protein